MRIYIYVCVYIYMYIYEYMYACIYMSICMGKKKSVSTYIYAEKGA